MTLLIVLAVAVLVGVIGAYGYLAHLTRHSPSIIHKDDNSAP